MTNDYTLITTTVTHFVMNITTTTAYYINIQLRI